MTWRTWGMVAMGLLVTLMSAATASAQMDVAATLSVLAGPVERIPVGAAAQPGVSGMNLAEGDRVKAGAGGIALITFLDGSTVTVLSDSDVTVKQVESGRGKSGVRLLLHAGRVWARVVQAAGSRSSLTLESNEYAATARDGLIGAGKSAEGFVCWSRRGTLTLVNRGGQTEAVLLAGQRAWARLGWTVTPEPFVPSASVLEVRTSGPVLPLVRMPDGEVAAGFLSEDVEVNQVFGSLTEAGRGQRWLVEVPAGSAGAYTLVLTGTNTGPYTVRIATRYAGFTVSRQEIRGDARPDERLVTRIVHRVKGDDPRTARAVETRVEALRVWEGEEPALVVATPDGARRPTAD
jgi:hypothetical protein